MDDTSGTIDNTRSGPDALSSSGKQFSVVDSFDRGPHLYSTRTSEGFEAVDKKSGERLILWVLRFPLGSNSEEAARFTTRLEKIRDLSLPTPHFRTFGVDSRGAAYLLTDLSHARPLMDSTYIPFHMEQMFVDILKAVRVLHRESLFLGDISEDSFMLSPEGKVLMTGVMGTFESGARQTAMLPPTETLHYIAPDQRSGNGPDIASDVYALGVYAYRLFTGRYLHGDKQTGSLADDPVASAPAPSVVRSDLPNWLDDVLGKCLELDPVNRYRDADEILRVVEEAIRTGQAPGGSSPWSRRTMIVPATTIQKAKRSDLTTTPKKEATPATQKKPVGGVPGAARGAAGAPVKSKSKTKFQPKRSRAVQLVTWAFAFAIGLGGAGFVFFFVNNWDFSRHPENPETPAMPVVPEKTPEDPILFHSKYAPPELKPLIEDVASADLPVERRESALTKLAESDDQAAYSVVVAMMQSAGDPRLKQDAQRLLLEILRRQQLGRSADVLEKWFRAQHQTQKDPASSVAYAHFTRAVQRLNPIKARKEAMQQAFSTEPVVALQLAAALALEDSEEQFLPVLRKFLSGEMSAPELEGKGLGALLLSHRGLQMFIDSDLAETIKRFSDADLRWALQRSAQSDRTLLFDLAAEAVRRKMLPPYQNVFLEQFGKGTRESIPWPVQQALVTSAVGEIGEAEVQEFARWISIESEQVLLAICAVAKDQVAATNAFDTLAARSLRTEPAASLVSWVREKFWDYRKRVVKAVGVLGLADISSKEDLNAAFESLLPFSQGGLFRVMAGSGNSHLIEEAIIRLGAITSSQEILPLLNHEDKAVRIEAVKALKGRNELAALQGILRAFEKETDPDVHKVYLEVHWVTRDRAAKKDGL